MSEQVDRREFMKYRVVSRVALGVSHLPVVSVKAAEFVGSLPRAEVCDVVVAGMGMAGMPAAVSAAEHGAKVVQLDKQQQARAGGNSALAMGAS